MTRILGTLLFIAFQSAVASAQSISIENRFVRSASVTGPEARVAAYAAFANSGASGDRLVGASCACSEKVEIHQMVGDGERRQMIVAPSLQIPAAGRAEIRPGSEFHMMLIGLRTPIVDGQIVPMALRFERAGEIIANFTAVGDTAAAWTAASRSSRPSQARAAGLRAELQPLAFLVGSCWRGSFPGGQVTDKHCFTPMFGGAFLRDIHVVEGAPTAYSGETVYRFDAETRQIRFDYYASDGSHSVGTANMSGGRLIFPETHRAADGTTNTINTVWERVGTDAYQVLSESPTGVWNQQLPRMRMERVGPAPAR